ncbi:recQ-mediated genome instability protein 1 [Coemansia sp. RSA 2611]|nr:recQ-mediated genome instability protein 1 [Coemansia sp. RSA 2610]KAJ2382250.1 recQ-mediated genome instability protein 1 [Coemansia sp. RSA 2611]
MIDSAGCSAAIKRKYGVSVRPQWLEKCASHIEAELANNASGAHLEVQTRLAIEQLLHSEISESCFPVLAVDSQQQVTRLPAGTGAFLQIQEIMDVGISKHAMWEAVREKEAFEQRGVRPSYLPDLDDDNDSSGVFTASTQNNATQAPPESGQASGEREPKIPHSMLKLVLTDGQTRVSALELTPIPQLHVELPIGTKVLVKSGRFLQPTGVLILDASGIQVLGGAPAQYKQFTLRSRLRSYLDQTRAAAAAP